MIPIGFRLVKASVILILIDTVSTTVEASRLVQLELTFYAETGARPDTGSRWRPVLQNQTPVRKVR